MSPSLRGFVGIAAVGGVAAAIFWVPPKAEGQDVLRGATPFRWDYPNVSYDYGPLLLPKSVAGGSKGPGTVNAQGLYQNGYPVVPAQGTIADGHCVQVTGGLLVDFGAPCGGSGGGGGSSSNVVATRSVTGTAAAPIASTDDRVCLDGPTEADLEANPTVGRTHVIIDCRTTGGTAIKIVAAGSNTINGASSISMTQNSGQMKQAVTVTFFANYSWRVN